MFHTTIPLVRVKDIYYCPLLDHVSSSQSDGYMYIDTVEFDLEYEVRYRMTDGDPSVGDPSVLIEVDSCTWHDVEVSLSSEDYLEIEEELYEQMS